MTPEKVLESVSSTEQGLSRAEAEKRWASGLGNILSISPRVSPWTRFVHHLKSPISLLLTVVGIAATVMGHFLDGGVLLGVIFLNSVIGVIHERRADRSIEAIQNLCASMATVWRDGRREVVEGTEIVLGDLVELESGQRVPVDLRLFQTEHLRIDESALTGESIASCKAPDRVEEAASIADQSCMAFAGTMVCAGKGRGVVVGVGATTIMGTMGTALQEMEERATPLIRQLDKLGKWLTVTILGAAIAVFLYGLWAGTLTTSELFLTSVAFAAAAIPEGLSAALTIAFGIGVGRMASQKAIVRRLPVVEALGSVTVICSDKTGTLTTNEMTVEEVITLTSSFRATGGGWNPTGTFKGSACPAALEAFQACCLGCLLCNDANVHLQEDGSWKPSGDPTEVALVVAAIKGGISTQQREQYQRLVTVPFQHENPFMATLNLGRDGGRKIWVKGSPETVFARCSGLTPGSSERDFWEKEVVRAAAKGLRLVAVASKESPESLTDESQLEEACHNLQLLGIVAMADPPHESVAKAIQDCRRAGIQLKMITGDHLDTAKAIGRRIGLTNQGEEQTAITGSDWKKVPQKMWKELARRTQIFARTEPSQKLEIVKALQEAGEVVAMTGDGFNDAPALRRAEVGIACGADSADAAKEAASIVLTQGRFDAIAQAVAEGRTIYENIQKVVMFLLTTGASEAILASCAIFMGGLLPILPIQILWTNLITTLVLGLALAFGTSHPGMMQRPPRHPTEALIPRDLKLRLGWGAVIGAVLPFLFFDWAMEHGRTVEEARTLCMTVLLMGEIALMISLQHLRENRWDVVGQRPQGYSSWLGGLTVFGLQLALIYIPSLQGIMGTAPLHVSDWFAIAACWGCQLLSFEWLKGWSQFLPLRSQTCAGKEAESSACGAKTPDSSLKR